MALLKLAPVFLLAFVFPLLFLPMLYPPSDPVNVKTSHEETVKKDKEKDMVGDGGGGGGGRARGAPGDGEGQGGGRGGSKKTR